MNFIFSTFYLIYIELLIKWCLTPTLAVYLNYIRFLIVCMYINGNKQTNNLDVTKYMFLNKPVLHVPVLVYEMFSL